MIKLDSLNKFFNKGKSNEIHVINDVSLEFPDHGMVAIFGRSGCGKTTLLNVVGGLDKVQSGSVFISGQAMSAKQDELRNRYIGYIFQNYCLNMSESCFDNVADALRLCGMREEEVIQERVLKALDIVGMKTYYKRTPDSLSGGQQQRVAIARAIVKNSPIILADEPTGNLDEANTVLVMDLLKQISKDHLVLLVTHEAKLVDYYCDSVIELSDGRVVNVRNNEEANGYIAKDKNTIYLGEYEKTTKSDEVLQLDYFGELPEQPVKAKLINRNGILYLKVETPGIHVLDESSETHIEEGCFEEKSLQVEESKAIDMSVLQPFEGKNYGRLYSFKDGLKSGYELTSSRLQKKSAKRLRKVLVLLGIVSVFLLAFIGKSIKAYFDEKRENASNFISVYLRNSNDNAWERVLSSGSVDRVIYQNYVTNYDGYPASFSFDVGSFETYSQLSLFGDNSSSIVYSFYLPTSDAKKYKLAEGTTNDSEVTDVFITTKIADELLKNKSYKFIKSYEDLIGLSCAALNFYEEKTETMSQNDFSLWLDQNYCLDMSWEYSEDEETVTVTYGMNYVFRVAGILESDETIVFLNDRLFENEIYSLTDNQNRYMAILHSSDFGNTLNALSVNGISFENPKLAREDRLQDLKLAAWSNVTSILIVLAIICFCMFFIMRSVFMVRVKDLGIARAIGVSKKNLLFRTFVETGVMAMLSIMIGYFLATLFIVYLQNVSLATARFFYYPWFMKIFIFVFLLVISIVSGSISVWLILRKTPSEIMAKYDI